jgi:hypothetical protein
LISVTFVYSDEDHPDKDRPDPFSEYRAGFEIRTRKRCVRIETRTHAEKVRLVRTYHLDYLYQQAGMELLIPRNGVSLLSQIRVVENLKIQNVLLYFARVDGKSFEVPVTYLRFIEKGSAAPIPVPPGGGATSIDGIISTRRGNAGGWASMIGKFAAGEWELTLPDTEEMKNRFKNEEIEDILFVITYAGRTPDWPR